MEEYTRKDAACCQKTIYSPSGVETKEARIISRGMASMELGPSSHKGGARMAVKVAQASGAGAVSCGQVCIIDIFPFWKMQVDHEDHEIL